MLDEFRSFASILAEAAPSHATAVEPAAVPVSSPQPEAHADARVLDLLDAFVAELARLRARAAERLEEAIDAVVADVARRVLARELHAAPVAMEALLDDALRDFDAGVRVTVRLSPRDAARLTERTGVEVDPALGPGDFALEVDDGRFEASLQTRLDALLASHRALL